jgi:hypothetical protein
MESPEQALNRHAKALKKGGDKAVTLFINVAIGFVNAGTPQLASAWVGIAVPALPKRDRLFALDCAATALFGTDFDFEAATRDDDKLQ